MGIYYLYVCHSRKEYIDPAYIADEVNTKGYGIKAGPVILNHCPNIVANYQIYGPWSECDIRLIGDHGSGYETACEKYKNVTNDAIEKMKYYWEERIVDWRLKYIPPDDESNDEHQVDEDQLNTVTKVFEHSSTDDVFQVMLDMPGRIKSIEPIDYHKVLIGNYQATPDQENKATNIDTWPTFITGVRVLVYYASDHKLRNFKITVEVIDAA